MAELSWTLELQGKVKNWTVGGVFAAIGFVFLFLVPHFATPSLPDDPIYATGTVLRLESDGDTVRPVFGYNDSRGTEYEIVSAIKSSPSSYHEGEQVTVAYASRQPENAIVFGDKDLEILLLIFKLLGAVLFAIGVAVLALQSRGMDAEAVSRIGGLIGALSFAVPASLALPALYWEYQHRPNMFFAADAAWSFKEWMLGGVFSAIGSVTLLATLALYRYQAKTGKPGWSWHWEKKL